MAPPKGNRFWEARSSSGRKPIFATPDELWKACVEYFEWVEDNPLEEEKVAMYQGEFARTTVKKLRPMTLTGLAIFLDIDISTWSAYRHKDDFSAIVAQVDQVMYTQKFSGAVADLMNANIIARDLRLTDKKELSSDPKKPLVVIGAEMSSEEATELYQSLLDD